MANRLFDSTQALEKQVKFIGGIISIAADASVSGKTGLGYSVAKTGTGEYTVTLEDAYPELLCAQVTLEAATAVDLVAQVKATTVSTTKTVVINLNAVATPSDPSAVCKIHFLAVLKNTII